LEHTDHPAAPKVAMVTGTGSGVDKATALALLQAGYRVVLAGRRLHALDEVACLSGVGPRASVVPTDVTDERAVVSLFDAALCAFGRVDVLFNNAGISGPAVLLEERTLADWQGVVNVNMTGMFLCLRQSFRVMKTQSPQGGRIINNRSIAAITPRPNRNTMAYCATNHAVTGMTKAASLDARKYNIAVGQIDIGNAATEMAQPMQAGIVQANGTLLIEPLMGVNVVGQSVLYMASLPLEANVLFHTVMATRMPFVGRG